MMQFLSNLEPRREDPGVIIADELDEFNEVLFFTKGEYHVGFTINRETTYVLRFTCDNEDSTQGNMIGAYNITFQKRSLFVYRTESECQGYQIRQSNWLKLFDDHKEIGELFQTEIKREFDVVLLNRVMREKDKEIEKWQKRQDYNGILQVQSDDFTFKQKSTKKMMKQLHS